MIVPFNGYLLAVLNSKLADWFIRQYGVTRNGGYFEYKQMFVERLPVPVLSEDQQKPFADWVSFPNQQNQKNIDNRIYELYNLSTDEVEFIEGLMK